MRRHHSGRLPLAGQRCTALGRLRPSPSEGGWAARVELDEVRGAWRATRQGGKAPGPDGVSLRAFRHGLEDRIRHITRVLRRGEWTHGACRLNESKTTPADFGQGFRFVGAQFVDSSIVPASEAPSTCGRREQAPRVPRLACVVWSRRRGSPPGCGTRAGLRPAAAMASVGRVDGGGDATRRSPERTVDGPSDGVRVLHPNGIFLLRGARRASRPRSGPPRSGRRAGGHRRHRTHRIRGSRAAAGCRSGP